ncbi:MAG: ABC transporter substrate-binding protein [Deltaproteobacteria bacterium]|nr:ABC transporter substrate-binding protein [Deltaproteobacteria bacterium]
MEISSPTPEVLRLIGLFRKGLRDLGWFEGQNLAIEYRYAEGKAERLPELAAELVRLKVDLIATHSGSPIRAAKEATKTIPIVMVVSGDPVAQGFVASLARPGGNITGLSILSPELSGKRLELLKETVPGLSRVAVLSTEASRGVPARKEVEVAASALRLQLRWVVLRTPTDLQSEFEAALRSRPHGLLTMPDPILSRDLRIPIVELAAKHRLPAMYGNTKVPEVGGLMAYGSDSSDNFRRAAVYIDKILKGTKPADLPVEQPMKFEFVINLKAAKQIGLTIPPNVLVRAQKVIR